jgi:hypothetical protein
MLFKTEVVEVAVCNIDLDLDEATQDDLQTDKCEEPSGASTRWSRSQGIATNASKSGSVP